jgi:uroporphyrinogen decarboxylase
MVASLHQDGLAVAGFLQQTLFELAWEMRGMEELLVDFYLNKPFADCLLDKITEIRCKMAARYAEAGVDILRLGDDLGTQRALMISPKTWEEMLMSRLGRIIAAARKQNPGIIIFFHSDGFIEPIIEDLIEIGVDVLNPIQPECMDVAALKKKYGDRLSFWGGVGIQTTMPFGTPAEVKEVVKWTIETLGVDGGFLISPTHALQSDVPWENVVAFFEAVDQFGWY